MISLPHLPTLRLPFLLCLLLSVWANLHSQEDGFSFEFSEDFDTEFDDVVGKVPGTNEYTAIVGKIFHLAVPNAGQKGKNGFVAKQQNKSHLPHWLVFNKKTGIFWGIPLQGDEGTLGITVSSLGDEKMTEHIVVNVLESSEDSSTTDKCKPNEDRTILTLLLDKNLRAIKPKQRVIAINNLAMFFKFPYSAFIMKPQLEQDDITDNSVILAGPGNVQSKSSKLTSYLEVLVGCDGRVWESTASLIHNLKQQARDGTISEVLRLPLLGWRVKLETKSRGREKRETIDDYGSGDYDEDYYQDYDDDYEDEDDLGDLETDPPLPKQPVTLPAKPTTPSTTSTTTTPTTTTTVTTTPTPSSHPHRHHHGEVKPSEEYESNIPILTHISQSVPEARDFSTTQSTITSPKDSGPTKIDILKPKQPSDFEDEYDYGSYDDDEDDIESATVMPDLAKKVVEIETSTFETVATKGTTKEAFDFVPDNEIVEVSTPPVTSTVSTTTTTTEAPTTFEIVEDSEPPVFVTEIISPAVTTVNITQEHVYVTSTTTATTTTTTTTAIPTISSSTTQPTTTTQPSTTQQEVATTQAPTTLVTDDLTTLPDTTTKSTTVRHIPSSTTESFVTEHVDPVDRKIPIPRNFKPYIENRLQYKFVTAGKVFRFVIPKNTFKDAEDGYNLTMQVLDSNEQPISKNSWLQFNPLRRELYGLPLAEDVHTWVYTVRATDKEGDFEQDQLTIQVQQHPQEPVFNHEFSLNLRIEKPQEYPHYIDWSLKVLRALGKIYNTNMSEITVRRINFTTEPVVFTWSNDSLSSNYCPRNDIEELFKMLTANDRGDPSRELSQMLAPDLRVKKVLYKNLSMCIEQQPPPPVTAINNFSPFLRNPVDIVNATLGELLVVKVKDDTFYDPEDVDPSMLNITLQTADFQPIPPTNWLQFDSKNREFFGIPRKTGITQYWLVCVDSGGKSAKDSLEVNVRPSEKIPYNVEFSMTIEVPFETFSNNAVMQKKFVEKLMEIFEEPSPKNFHFLPYKAKRERDSLDSTVVYWFNKSLPVDKCPTEDIKRLEYLLHNSDSRSISSRLHRIMGPDFTVSTIKVHHIGNCKPKPVVIPTPDLGTSVDDPPPPAAENDYMVTYIIPAVIVGIMVFFASVAACVLYRRRRMGKMNVEEDGRQAYGNKGIPVIFQEELEEKPEPGTKAPVILKDERPPLAPPEYSKSGSVKLEDSEPYQPPPPFTRTQDNGRQPRPKPTPTYRKPPPYVPP